QLRQTWRGIRIGRPGVRTLGAVDQLELAPPPRRVVPGGPRQIPRALEPQRDSLKCGPCPEQPAGQGLPRTRVLGERLLRRLAPSGNGREQLLRFRALRHRRGGDRLGGRKLRGHAAHVIPPQLEPRLERLALEALVQLRGLGLALERPQPRARLALDIQGAIEVVLRALELELSAPAALAVLAEPGRLLDQQPAVA